MANNMVQYLHVLDPGFPIDYGMIYGLYMGYARGYWHINDLRFLRCAKINEHQPFLCAGSSKKLSGYLVGGIPTPLKNMKVNGKDYPQYIMESHNPFMFQTTKQIMIDHEILGPILTQTQRPNGRCWGYWPKSIGMACMGLVIGYLQICQVIPTHNDPTIYQLIHGMNSQWYPAW